MNRGVRVAGVPITGMSVVTKEVDEELALFLEMRKLEKERRNHNLLSHSVGELDPPLGAKPETAPIFKIAPSAPVRKTGIDDFLNSDIEKNDYDWLLTPPGTPLFLSFNNEAKRSPIGSIVTPKAPSTVLKSRITQNSSEQFSSSETSVLANATEPTRNTIASRQQTSSPSGLNSAVGTCRPSSLGGRTHSSYRPATPTGRPTASDSRPARPSTPPSRSALPSRSTPPRLSTPTKSSTPLSMTGNPSAPAASKPASRSATPTRRPHLPSTVATTSASTGRSSSVTRSAATKSKSLEQSQGSSPTIKSRALKPSDIPGFSLDAPPNLRTSLPERPSLVSRGRSGAPSNRSSLVEPGPNVRPRRQSCSPSRGRLPNCSSHKGGSVPPPSRQAACGSDNLNPVVIGTKMVERIVNMRRLMPPKQDDKKSTQNNLTGKSSLSPDGTGFGRTLSKKSLDMALRHMDIRRSVPNSLRPLMANIPASSSCCARSRLTGSRAAAVSDSPLAATSSATSSEQSVHNHNVYDDAEIEDDLSSGRRRHLPSAR